ncbi:MAG TPA: hypothetical protein PLS81_01120 [Deltaproteobacteria bacterium]|nr:hypothetical protein [Deltaproteobacteria bacterium]HOM28043.1 hypothetical protein [Deltaproteobacteria bacterium]HPP80386.1 hypothetical protein [Deltaproteobacteria bacterium]
MITGRTRVYTILARPSVHVTAPMVYNHLFSRMGLDMVYISHDIPPEAVDATVASFASWENLGGFNVTVPHKESVARLVNPACPVAGAIGVVNTVVRRENGALEGYNTDGEGALKALGDVAGARCLILGAGGAARAVAYALAGAGASRISVMNRTPETARRLCSLVGHACVHVYDGEPLDGFDILVQATPVADRVPFDLDLSRLRPGARVLETVMRRTLLAQRVKDLGLELVSGYAMLYHQTPRNFELLTGIPLPERLLEEAFALVGFRLP